MTKAETAARHAASALDKSGRAIIANACGAASRTPTTRCGTGRNANLTHR